MSILVVCMIECLLPCFLCSSAGVGRTGTLICVRSMIQMIEDKGEVDIFNFVVEMRRKRMFMVQTKVCFPTGLNNSFWFTIYTGYDLS